MRGEIDEPCSSLHAVSGPSARGLSRLLNRPFKQEKRSGRPLLPQRLHFADQINQQAQPHRQLPMA